MGESLIPAKHADFYWNDDPNNPVTAGVEVLVVDRSPGQPPRSRANDPGHLDSSHGAMAAGWMEDGHPLHNPAGLFAYNWLARGSSPEAILAALRELAKIEECGWAREMLAAIEWRNRPDEPEED